MSNIETPYVWVVVVHRTDTQKEGQHIQTPFYTQLEGAEMEAERLNFSFQKDPYNVLHAYARRVDVVQKDIQN